MVGQRVVVFHPERQHSYQTAYGLQQAGLLELYLTGLYAKEDSALCRAARALLPAGLRGPLAQAAQRRHFDGLDETRIRSRPLCYALDLAARRSPLFRAAWPVSPRAWLAAMERWAGRTAARRNATAVIAYDGAACETFAAARAAGALSILDQTIGHVTRGRALFREEAMRYPAWALPAEGDDPDWMVEKCRAEALAADWILAASDYVRDTLLAIGVPGARIVAMPYGVDAMRFTPAPTPKGGRFRILFVGGIGLRKGVPYLLEAVKRLQRPDIELVLLGDIVGKPDGLRPYAGLFTHVPRAPRQAMPEWYRSADLFVFPSLHEGSSLAIYEALACGVPVITTPHAGSVVREGIDGFIVPIRDATALAERIDLLYRDKERRLAVAQSARARALEYTWARYHERLARWVASLALKAR